MVVVLPRMVLWMMSDCSAIDPVLMHFLPLLHSLFHQMRSCIYIYIFLI